MTSKAIKIALDHPQQPQLLRLNDADAGFVVEPAPSSSMSSNYYGLRCFLAGHHRRQRLVLNDVQPEANKKTTLPMSEDELARRCDGISDVIKHAWQAKDWFLIWGPPGTGKTSTAMSALVDLAMATPGMRVLLLAYTYRATDEICKMLEKRREKSGQENDLYIRIGNALKCDPQYRDNVLSEMEFKDSRDCRDKISKRRIVVSTVASLAPDDAIFKILDNFDLAIVDEASQLLDVHLLPLFCAQSLANPQQPKPLVGKFIFIGDHKQLPAVVQQSSKTSQVDDELLRSKGIINCRHSFFKRLWMIAGGDSNPNPSLTGLLSRQFRMHPTIAEFCNHFFYSDQLTHGDRPHQAADLPSPSIDADDFEKYVLTTRMGFFPVTKSGSGSDIKINQAESELCARVILTLLKHKAHVDNGVEKPYEESEIAVIVPFRNQIANVRVQLTKALQDLNFDADKILVDTVERVQGSGRPVIIFSTVIQNLFQSDMLSAKRYDTEDDDGDEDNEDIDEKLNVAVTRAEERFYLIGNETVLRGLRCYGDLLEYISNQSGFFEEPLW